MAVEIVSGRIAPTEPSRVKRGYALYDRLAIETDGGGRRELAKVSAAGAVKDIIARGGSGRFYVSKHAGMLGIHGARLDDGTAAYAHFNNVELIFLIGMAAGAFMLVVWLMGMEGRMITPVIVGGLLAIGYFVIRAGRLKAKAEFDAG